MDEHLDRHELPIQSIVERGEALTAVVPVHLAVLSMPKDARTDLSLIADAKETVSQWYNDDLEYYLRVLGEDADQLHWLRGYEKFDANWELEGKKDDNGFLTLLWREGSAEHMTRYVSIPVVLYNQFDENHKFYTAQYAMNGQCAEYFGRSITHPEIVYMPPEKMLKYGVENLLAKIEPEQGIAQVMGNAFCSDYYDNLAQAILLRNFTVFYLNKLLDIAKPNEEMTIAA